MRRVATSTSRRTLLVGGLAALTLAGCGTNEPAMKTNPRRTDQMADADQQLLDGAESGDAATVSAALAAGANVETRNARRRTPLLLAAAADRIDPARELLKHGADVNAVDDQSDTPFLVTGVTGSVAMLELLLPHHPNFKIYNRFGGTALIPACERGHVDFVRRAVRTGIEVNHVNELGWTGLLEAVILGSGGRDHQEIVRILLANGADPTIADRDGVTALQHARTQGYDEIVRLLRRPRAG